MRMRIGIAALCVLLLIWGGSALAQSEAPSVPTPEDFFNGILPSVSVQLSALIGSALVIALTAVLKWLPLFRDVEARTIQILMALIVLVVIWAARAAGYGESADTALAWLNRIADPALNLLWVLIGSTAGYHALRAADAPFFGKARS